jgi:glycosyltransferase involved in cell wall biosynthesis
MKFTIVITTYNRLSLLQRAINSALAQTITSEVIVVDDCSSDGTQECVSELCEELEKLGDKRLVYHRNPSNLGHSQSVNAGVERATGDWIKLIDDDDYLASNCVQEMVNAIALRPQAVLCSCQAIQVDENEAELSRTQPIGPGQVFYIPQEDIHYGMLLEQVPFGTPVQVAFRREAFLKTGGWDSSLDANFDDIDSWVKIAQYGDAIFINQCLAYRTIWSGSFNQKFSLQERLKTNILIKQKIYPLVSEKYRSEIPSIKTIENYLKLHWGLVALKHAQFESIFKITCWALWSVSAWNLLLERANRSLEVHPFKKLKTVPPEPEVLDIFEQIELKQVQALKRYVQLRWGLKALEKGNILDALKAACSAFFSGQAWKLLMVATFPKAYPQYYLSTKQIESNNLAAMQRIYELVNNKYHDALPDPQEMKVYLRLRLFGQSVKERKFIRASKFLLPTILSPVAWKALRNLARFRSKQITKSPVRKLVLIQSE